MTTFFRWRLPLSLCLLFVMAGCRDDQTNNGPVGGQQGRNNGLEEIVEVRREFESGQRFKKVAESLSGDKISRSGGLAEISDQLGAGLSSGVEAAKGALDGASSGIAPYAEDIQRFTLAELEKSHAYEYLVLDISQSVGADDLQDQLKPVGRDRWDCFQIVPIGERLRVFCKRRPQSYLQFIAAWPILARLIQ